MSNNEEPVTKRNPSLDEFFLAINPGKPLPRSGKCIFCAKDLTPQDIDHSVCNSCWTETFACKICGSETGECEHMK